MKRLIATAAAAVMLLSAAPLSASSEGEDAGGFVISYILENGEVTVTGCTGSDIMLMIPSEIEGCPVTAIHDAAFSRNNDIIMCTIPDSVRSIGERAFSSCDSLSTVTIGSGTAYIGEYAFTACPSLTNIDVMKGNPSYSTVDGCLCDKDGSTLLVYAGGKEAQINSSVKEIGKGAFFGRYDMTSVSVPDSVKIIDNNAFAGCFSLKEIVIPDSVTSLGGFCFTNCSALERVKLGKSLKSIPDYCFLACTSLRSVNIPDNITAIGSGAFFTCANISGIYIPSSVKTMGIEAVGQKNSIRDSDASENIQGFVIRGEKGSATEKYASELGLSFAEGHLSRGDADGNGRINAVDASMVLAEYALTSSGSCGRFSYEQETAADWNKSGSINAVDASLILAEYAALSTLHS